jgi:hypothetical protein
LNGQIFYSHGADGFSVNENFNAGNANTTAYHFTSGDSNRDIMFSLAKTSNFTNMFGTYGTSGANAFVIASETPGNTSFEFRSGVGIAGSLNLAGGTLLLQLSNDGQLYLPQLSNIGATNMLYIDTGNSGLVTYAIPTNTRYNDQRIDYDLSGTGISSNAWNNVVVPRSFTWSSACGIASNNYQVKVDWSAVGYDGSLAYFIELYNSSNTTLYTGSNYAITRPAVTTGYNFSGTKHINGSYTDIFTMNIANGDAFNPNLWLLGSVAGTFSSFRMTFSIEPANPGF